MAEAAKLSKREAAVLDKIRRDGPLHLQSDSTEIGADGGGYVFWTEVDGRRLPPKTTAKILASGLLTPLEDCLFPGAKAQTWVVA